MRNSTRSQSGSLFTLLICLSTAFLLSSCKKSPEQKILGKWNVEGEQSVVDYRKDGSFVTTQNGQNTTGKYHFTDDSHLVLELSGMQTSAQGTNGIVLRLNCEIAFHDDKADVTATLPGKPGVPAASKTIHYVRAK